MSLPTALLGILLFALATAILMVWGMRKSYFEKQTLMNMLLSKSAEKVMHYLKSHDNITEPEMRKLVEGISAGEFHSRKRIVAQADRAFTTQLINAMLHDGLIEPAQKGRQIYRKK
ncbi:MAG: hypothetical protein MJ077_05725 [Oscillospiraceae bacterium]|nr:hypothetical protein [Oscillospiraceae bacterium]